MYTITDQGDVFVKKKLVQGTAFLGSAQCSNNDKCKC